MTDTLLGEATALRDSIVADRRTIHAYPELAYQEEHTAAMVAGRLADLGIEARTGVGKTGVIGLIRGAAPGKTVLLRADMDALPIQETSDAEYRSKVDGVMHACGHDAHVAMLLGAAQVLQRRREGMAGNVKLMFQPAEEGGAGALRMIEDGLLEDPQVDAGFGLHVSGVLFARTLWVPDDRAMASADHFDIVVRGRGGHAATPHLTVDPIVVGAYIITALQTLVSREVGPLSPAVITVGHMTAGTTFNVIPDTATIRGTVRTYSAKLQDALEARIKELAQGIAGAMRAEAEVTYTRLYAPTINHAAEAKLMRDAAAEVAGPEVNVPSEPLMGSEDFSYVLQRVPGAFGMLGVRRPEWDPPKVNHNAAFDMDEDVLPVGSAILAATAMRYLAVGR
jgi:amidohydrolase